MDQPAAGPGTGNPAMPNALTPGMQGPTGNPMSGAAALLAQLLRKGKPKAKAKHGKHGGKRK